MLGKMISPSGYHQLFMASEVVVRNPTYCEVRKHLEEYDTKIFPGTVHQIILYLLDEPSIQEILLK
jgi:L-lysine 2,3-aminomutase